MDNSGVVQPGCEIPEVADPEETEEPAPEPEEPEPAAMPATEAQSARQMCESSGAIADAADNPGLVVDCATLLEAKDKLVGSATLNWAADTSMADWDGVTIGGRSLRVTQLDLSDLELDGSIPIGLGDLTGLVRLYLNGNTLSGDIPGSLGNLTNLKKLDLQNNQLSGCIPEALRNLRLSEKAIAGLPDRLGLAYCE